MLLLLTYNAIIDYRQRMRLSKVLPSYITNGDYDLAIIEVNRSCCDGLNKLTCQSLRFYIERVKSMMVDYNKDHLLSIIKNS